MTKKLLALAVEVLMASLAAAQVFALCLSLLLSPVCLAGEPLMFNEWAVTQADDGSSVAAITMLSEQAVFGEWCFYKSKKCTWELVINIECKVGDDHLVFANSTNSYSSLKVSCLGKSEKGDLYVYAFNWKDLESLIKSPTDVSKVAFAFPLKNSEFRVVRFSLNGLRESTGMLERRFFKGAQPASLTDQTL
jgi:hypothetical protein